MASPSPLHVLEDSGIPSASTDCTTIVLIHGYAWHSGIFVKLVPLAPKYNVRIILLNRRDYTGSTPFTEAERALLPSLSPEALGNASEAAAALVQLKTFMRERARELHDFLVQLVRSGGVSAADTVNNKGGITLVGWSFGTGLMTALLANVATFPVEDVVLSRYMRRVVFLDPPHHTIGLPAPEDPYNPLFDPEIPLEDREKAFANWVSGYYNHGDTPETLERKTHVADPPPTLSTLTPEEVARTLCLPPGAPGGSDAALLEAGLQVGLFVALKQEALYLPADVIAGADAWPEVEVRYVSCERSVWEMTWGTALLRKEVEAARAQGLPLRNVRLVFIKGANHFVHWDQPELALRALTGNQDVVG